MKRIQPYFTAISLLFFLIGSINAQTTTGTIEVDGITRDYRIYIPTTYNADNPTPLVFNLHGITSNAVEQEFYSEMNAVAEANGFITCYPNGVNEAWNVEFPFPASDADDVKFISNLIDAFDAEYNIDLNRVYSCGMSNGGYMSYRLACELTDRIAAIASVTGSIVPGQELVCNPSRPIPVMQMHGTADPTVPYNGGGAALPIEEVIQLWLDKNSCVGTGDTTVLPDIDPLDSTTVIRIDYQNCEGNSPVVFYKIDNGGHTWPGATFNIGTTTQDFEASEEIWNFFKQFSLPQSTATENEFIQNEVITLFPNPTTHDLSIQMTLANPTDLSRSLYNLQGQQVLGTETAFFPAGAVNWNYTLQDIPEGTYLLKVQNGARAITKKVVVLGMGH